jgi:enoyl-CoA hydratase/carnithine racemase
MASRSQPALWGTKYALRYWRDLQLSEHHRYYEAVVHRVLLAGDLVEGLNAFREKRQSQFSSGWPNPYDRK